MFRIGGSAGDGITSGLRQGYATGREVDTLRQRMDIVNQLAPRSDQGVNDFLIWPRSDRELDGNGLSLSSSGSTTLAKVDILIGEYE